MRAMRIRDRFLRSLEAKMNEGDMDAVIEAMDQHTLKLIKDSEDRGLGAPVQSHVSPDGSMTPVNRIVIEAARDNRDNPAST